MKNIRLIAVALFVSVLSVTGLKAQSSEDSLAFVSQEWNWIEVAPGAWAGHAEFDLFGAGQSISIVKYPAKKYKTSIVDAQRDLSAGTDKLAQAAGARFACNGSYFNMRELTPVTYISINHKQLGSTTADEAFRTNGLLAIKGRKLVIMPTDNVQLDKVTRKYRYAIATGPLLINNGATCEFTHTGGFTVKRHPRTIVGLDAGGTVYFVVIDGRWKNGKGTGASIPETAAVARYLGMVDALNFDGGGSSTVWTSVTGILNYPNDNGKWDHAGARKVPNCIIVK